MDKGVQKEVEESFRQIFEKIKEIYEFETAEIDFSKVDDFFKLVIEDEELYDEWIEKVESLSLPEVEKIETIDYADGPYLKIDYCLKTDFARLIRKIRIKSSGKISVFNIIVFEDTKNGELFNVEATYDTYGNLIFTLEKAGS